VKWHQRRLLHQPNQRGDQVFGKSKGTFKTEVKKDGSREVLLSGQYEWYGGTGRFEGTEANGTYSGKISPTGASYEFEGDYLLPD